MKNLLASAALTVGLSTAPALADSNNTSPESKENSSQKIEVVKNTVCDKTRFALECEKAGLQMPTQNEVSAYVSENPHYNEVLSDIQTLSAQALELIKRWELPQWFVTDIVTMKPLENKKDLSQLINDGFLLEEKDFEALTKLQKLSRENLAQVISILFESSDFDTWRTNPNTWVLLSQEASDNEKSAKLLDGYKKEREKSGDRYIKMFDVTDSSARINKNEKAQKVLWAELDTAISLFNEWKEKLVVDSKETYARLLNASFGIAFIEWRGQIRNKWENNINLLDSFSNYLILTGQTNSWNKISYGDLKHNLAEFGTDTNISKKYAEKFDKIANNFLVAMNKEAQEEQEQYAEVVKWQELDSSIAQLREQWQELDSSITQLREQWQELDSSIAQLREQWQELDSSIAKLREQWQELDAERKKLIAEWQELDSSIAQLDKKMSDRLEFLVVTIISGIQAYETTWSDAMLTDVYKGINMLVEMKPMVQKVEKYQQMHTKAVEDIQPYLSKLPEDKIDYIASL